MGRWQRETLTEGAQHLAPGPLHHAAIASRSPLPVPGRSYYSDRAISSFMISLDPP